MEQIYRAYFTENGHALITLSGHRVEKHALSQAKNGELKPSLIWASTLENCVNVVEAPQSGRLVATDTSGRHFGLCPKTGDHLWQSESVGEGDPGVVVAPPQSQERFVFATWSGILQQLDPATGTEIASQRAFLSQLRGLQATKDARELFVTVLVPAKSDSDPVGEVLSVIDLVALRMREVSLPTFSRGIFPCPTGQKALFVSLVDDPGGARFNRSEHWQIMDLTDGKMRGERTFGPKEILSRNAVWSPDGQFIATAEGGRHLMISAQTLEICGTVVGDGVERPAFHPAGTHICLCRAHDTQIVPISALLSDA